MSFALTAKKRRKKPFEGFVPHDYQEDCIARGVSQPCAGFFLDPGLGKTVITYSIFDILRRKKAINGKMLVVAKLRIIYNVWPKEAKKWNLPYKLSIIHGTEKQRIAAMQEDADVYLVNYDNVKWLSNNLKHFAEVPDMLTLDESTKIKSHKSKRFKALRKMCFSRNAKGFTRRYILTGTPTPNGMMDIWSQAFILDAGKALGKFITAFRNRFFLPAGFKGKEWELRDGGDEEIYDALGNLVVRYDDDEIDMPELHTIPRYVNLPDKVMKQYLEMERELISEMSGNLVTAANAAVATGKCRQIANGSIYLDDLEQSSARKKKSRRVVDLHDEKVEEVVELVEELNGKPCLIAYEFNHDLDKLKKAFPNAPHIGSGVSPKEAKKIEDDWNAGKIPVLLGHPESIAHGLNLQESGNVVIFYALTWNLENYDQFRRRIWRQGQKSSKVLVYHIIAAGTVDEVMQEVVQEKHLNQKVLLDALKKRTREEAAMAKSPKLKPDRLDPDAAITAIHQYLVDRESTFMPRLEQTSRPEQDQHNFLATLEQSLAGLGVDELNELLTEIYGKDIAFEELGKAHKALAETLEEVFGIVKDGDHLSLQDPSVLDYWPEEPRGEATMSNEETNTTKKKGAAKSKKKTAAKTKAAAKSKTSKKASSKKKTAAKAEPKSGKKVRGRKKTSAKAEGGRRRKAKVPVPKMNDGTKLKKGTGEPQSENRAELVKLVGSGCTFKTLREKGAKKLKRDEKAVANMIKLCVKNGYIKVA